MTETKQLILCEDSKQDFELFKMALEDLGLDFVELVWLKDGEEALDFFKTSYESSPDQILILDINMPKRNGFEVLEFLQSDPRFNFNAKFICSTSESPSDVKKAKELGAEFKTKPFGFDELKDSVASICATWFS